MAARYVHNYEAFDRLVLTSGALHERLNGRGERVAEAFRATAPVGEPFEGDDHPGRFRDSVGVHTEVGDFGHGRRVNTRVRVEDPNGLSIEMGHHAANGRYVEGSRTLTNAIDAARD